MTTWADYLNDLNHRVDLALEALDSDEEVDPMLLEDWAPPTDLGPLPIEQAAAVQATLDRYAEVIKLMTTASESIRQTLSQLSQRSARSQGALPHYGDSAVPQYVDRSV